MCTEHTVVVQVDLNNISPNFWQELRPENNIHEKLYLAYNMFSAQRNPGSGFSENEGVAVKERSHNHLSFVFLSMTILTGIFVS